MMEPLLFPPTSLSLKRVGNQVKVQCLVRKTWLALTPEEWVRQHVIGFLINHKGVNTGRISVEKSLVYNQQIKRWDIATFDQHGEPAFLIECKRPSIPCSMEVMVQISTYQQVFKAQKLIKTNGLVCHVYEEGVWNEGLNNI